MTSHTQAAELQQLSSFYRLLNQASGSRSEREVMRVFIEALAVWQDSESWAYFADVTGRFVLDVSLPGSDPSRVPTSIDDARVTSYDPEPVRIAPVDLGLMGFHGVSDVLISRLHIRGASDWLIVTEDRRENGDSEARLAVYVQAVIQALNDVSSIHASRLTWAMLEHLLSPGQSVVQAARRAVDELGASADTSAWLSVFQRDGTPLLAVGALGNVLTTPDAARAPNSLVIPIPLPEPYQGVVGIHRPGDRPLMGRDEQLLRLAASTFGTWLSGVAGRLATEQERRAASQSFDHMVKQRIDEAGASGAPISLIVISLGADMASTQAVHECVAQIRRQLRPADMAGRSSSGRIGVLLPGTSAERAYTVVERLRELLTSDAASRSFNISIDLTRPPGAV